MSLLAWIQGQATGAAESAGQVDLGELIMHHLTDAREIELPFFLGTLPLPQGWYVDLGPLDVGKRSTDRTRSRSGGCRRQHAERCAAEKKRDGDVGEEHRRPGRIVSLKEDLTTQTRPTIEMSIHGGLSGSQTSNPKLN